MLNSLEVSGCLESAAHLLAAASKLVLNKTTAPQAQHFAKQAIGLAQMAADLADDGVFKA